MCRFLAAEQRPDVALLDIRMPKMNGIEAACAYELRLVVPGGAD
ncbi:hypothetical protein [Streptomyces sp. 7N604]